MQDLIFYNAGCEKARGLRGVVVLFRRLLRRLLRPIFLRQVEIFQEMAGEIGALTRHYAALRSHVETLARRQDDLIDGLTQRFQGVAEGASREDEALRAEQRAELQRYRRELERYVSDCNAIVRRLSILDARVDELLSRAAEQPRKAA